MQEMGVRMARVEWVEERLQVWARWRLARGKGGTGRLGYAAVKWGPSNSGRSGYITAAIPLLEAEASQTDAAIQALPAHLAKAVAVVYCEPGTAAHHAVALHCAVSTVYARIEEAHRLLRDALLQRQRSAAAERARVEGLQRRRSAV
jgi:hypothetical protein